MESAKPPPSLLAALGAALGLGVLLAGALVFAIPAAERMGLSPKAAQRLPYLGLLLGVTWGISLRTSRGARLALRYLGAPSVVGGMFWLLSLLVGGVMVAAGVPEPIADRLAQVAFFVGAAVGLLPLLAWATGGRRDRAKGKAEPTR